MEKIQAKGRIIKKVTEGMELYMFIYMIKNDITNELKIVSVVEDINGIVYDVIERDFELKELEKLTDVSQLEFIKDMSDFYEIQKNHIIISENIYNYDNEKFEDNKGEKLIGLRILHIRQTLFKLNRLPKVNNSVANIFINKNKPEISALIINSATEKPEYEIFIYKKLTDSGVIIVGEISFLDTDKNIKDMFSNFTIKDVGAMEVSIYEVIKMLSIKTKIMFSYGDWDNNNVEEQQIHRFFLDKKLWK